MPSDADIQLTYHAAEVLGLLNIPLLEHLVFAENRYACIMKNHYRLGVSASTPGFAQQNSFLVDLKSFLDIADEDCIIPDPFEEAEAKKDAKMQAE